MNAPSTSMDRTSLDPRWIDGIFEQMREAYGSQWIGKWSTGEVVALPNGAQIDKGMLGTKRLWAERLSGFAKQPDRIKRAMESLPLQPPSLPEFIALCRQQSGEKQRALSAPRPAPETVAPKIEAVSRKLAGKDGDFLSWARTPPAPGCRGPWSKAIIECAERGDSRFLPILQKHVDAGVITSERAKTILGAAAESAEG